MKVFHRGRKRKESASRRRVFGFPCDQGLQLRVRIMAAGLQVPIYVLAEHVIEEGMRRVLENADDDVHRRLLRDHLIREHLLLRDPGPLRADP